MRFSTFASFIALALAAVSAGCSSSSSGPAGAPVIDSLDVPSSFTVNGTEYSVSGTLTFHDDTGTVTQLHEKIPAYNLDNTSVISGASAGQTTATVLLGFTDSAAVASGTVVEIDVSVLDDNNVESNVEVEQVTVP